MAITNRQTLLQNIAKGFGSSLPITSATPGATTAANAGSGHISFSVTLGPGSVYPGTLIGVDLPPALPNELLTMLSTASVSIQGGAWLVRYYLLGTLNLAATGDQFTHDAATFPVLREKYSEASKPVTLLPVVYLTTALTTTAAQIVMKTNAGGAGYVDQDGNNVVGTKTFTFPSVSTAVQSAYVLMMENADSGILDITQIDVDTASATGAANVYGVELLCPLGAYLNRANLNDMAFGGLSNADIAPAVATSGTVTTMLGYVTPGATGRVVYSVITSVLNT